MYSDRNVKERGKTKIATESATKGKIQPNTSLEF